MHNTTAIGIEPWLEIAWPLLDWLDMYLRDGDATLVFWQSGDQRPFPSRPINATIDQALK